MKPAHTLLAPLFLVAALAIAMASPSGEFVLPNAVFKINAFQQSPNLRLPWLDYAPSQGTGSGFVLKGGLILTNAHVVRHAKYLEVRKENDSRRFIAEVRHISHVCDLAMLEVKDPAFLDEVVPLELGGIPGINTVVQTIGFPIGGDNLSVTNGVVSRIEKIIYSHSSVDEHLAIQIDAAINPGNSGGPVLQNGKVVGMAFQGIRSGDNIGYMIPTTVLSHFIKDAEDGRIHGVPELGCYFRSLPPAMRSFLKFPEDSSGVLVVATNPQSAVHEVIHANDILTAINGHPISDDGNIWMDGIQFAFYEIIERSQYDDRVQLQFFRDGRMHETEVGLTLLRFPVEIGRTYEMDPGYFLYAGMTFVRLTGDTMRTFGKDWWLDMPQVFRLLYYHQVWLTRHEPYRHFIILSEVLSDSENMHAKPFTFQILESVNGQDIHRLADLPGAIKEAQDGYHILRFRDNPAPLVFSIEAAAATHERIRERYHVLKPVYLPESGEMEVPVREETP